jgi:hypothetical protein
MRFELPSLPGGSAGLRAELRAFLAEAGRDWPPAVRARSWMGFDRDFSRELGARGWIGMVWPKAYGGHERSGLERVVVLEELLAVGAPVGAHWIGDRQSGPLILRRGRAAQPGQAPSGAQGKGVQIQLVLLGGAVHHAPGKAHGLAARARVAVHRQVGWREHQHGKQGGALGAAHCSNQGRRQVRMGNGGPPRGQAHAALAPAVERGEAQAEPARVGGQHARLEHWRRDALVRILAGCGLRLLLRLLLLLLLLGRGRRGRRCHCCCCCRRPAQALRLQLPRSGRCVKGGKGGGCARPLAAAAAAAAATPPAPQRASAAEL